MDRAASWTKEKGKMKQERGSRYENPRVATANRFEALREVEGSDEEMKGSSDCEGKGTMEANKETKGKRAEREKNKKEIEISNGK